MNDKVFIRNLIVPCNIGITEEERQKKQNVIFDIEIFCNLSRAGATDDIEQTLDYYRIKEELTTMVVNSQFKLLESLAQTVGSIVLQDPKVSSVKVAVKKEKYSENPVLGIEISRDRHG